MSVNIAPKISLPEGITLREGVEIRLVFVVDEVREVENQKIRDFGLAIELWAEATLGPELVIGGTVHDLPDFDDQALIALRVAQHEPNRTMLAAAADWYARNYEFTLRREAQGTEDDYVLFEMQAKDKPDSEVHGTEPFYRDVAEKYFMIP